MSKLVRETKQALRQAVLDAMGKAVADGALPPEPIPAFTVEVPADRANGDYATNAAMACAKAFQMCIRDRVSAEWPSASEKKAILLLTAIVPSTPSSGVMSRMATKAFFIKL